MQLFLHLGTNIEYFKLLNDGFLLSMGKDDKEIAKFFSQNFPGELAENISPQYEIHFQTLKELKRKFGPDVFQKVDGVYYGSDNCEYLAAYKKDIEQARNEFLNFNKKFPPHKVRTFTLVTPYVGNTMIKFLEESLEFLQEKVGKYPVEVVVNDFGVLRLLHTKFTKLTPVMGRVIHKLLKTPLIDTFGYDVHPSGEMIKNLSAQDIEKLKSEVIKWQLRFYNSAELSLGLYRDFLKKYNIVRVALDFMEKRQDLYDNSRFGDIGVDVYYPWALIFTGRLCDTSAIENPSRGYYATDDICPRTCNRYDISFKIKTSGYKMIQRGNAGYRSELNLDYLSKDFIKNDANRLVFAPFVSV